MGIGSFFKNIFGGGGGSSQDRTYGYQYLNPQEDMLNLQIYAQQIADNPALAEQLTTPDGLNALKRMGFDDSFINEVKQKGPSVIQKEFSSYAMPLPSLEEYKSLSDKLKTFDTTLGGEYIPPEIAQALQYQQLAASAPTEYGQFQFSDQSLSPIADKAFEGLSDMQKEKAMRDYQRSLLVTEQNLNNRGLGLGGIADASKTSLGRALMENIANINRETEMQKAQGMLDVGKFNIGQQFNKEQAQSGEGKYAANLAEQARQYNQNFNASQNQYGANLSEQQRQYDTGVKNNQAQTQAQFELNKSQAQKEQDMRNLQAQSAALSDTTNRAMIPYGMASDYFKYSGSYAPPVKQGGSFGTSLAGLGSLAQGIGTLIPKG